jgi:hypothetical protein
MFVIQASPDRLEEGIRLLGKRSDRVRARPGLWRAYLLVDRQGGELATCTLWESEQAMNEAQPAAREILAPAMQAMGGQVPQPKLYEVALEL